MADDQRIRDQQILLQIAHSIVDKWEELALYLGLTESDVSTIKYNNYNDYGQQKTDFLLLWRRKFADKATYERLVNAATALRRTQLAKTIARITGITIAGPSTTPPIRGTSAASGSGIPFMLDAQLQIPQQHRVLETSGQVNPNPNTMTAPQNLQTSQAMSGQGDGRVPAPPSLGSEAGVSSGQQSTGFQLGIGGKLQQQAPGGAPDPEKRKQIQQQLVLLLHAQKCQQRGQEQNMRGDYTACSLPHCRTMKDVLNHMTLCQAGRNCQYPHCASSRQILTHWKNCHRPDCPVCLPLKKTSSQERRGTDPNPNNQARVQLGGMGAEVGMGRPVDEMGGPSSSAMGGPNRSQVMNMQQEVMAGGSSGFGMPSSHQGFTNTSMMMPEGAVSGDNTGMMQQQGPVASYGGPVAPGPSMAQPTYVLPIPQISSVSTQPWHDEINLDLRQHLVRELVGAIYPVHDPITLQDKRLHSLIQYAMKVENIMFDSASGREDYYKLIAQKIYRIRKEVEDRKKDRITALEELLSFPSPDGTKVNLAVEITGVDCSTLCTLLLKDDNGSRFSAIEDECMKNAEKMNHRIFTLWLSGEGKQPATWSTLAGVLRDADLNRLAAIIEVAKHLPKERKGAGVTANESSGASSGYTFLSPPEFCDSMTPDQLYSWLLSNQLSEKDCKLLKDCNKGGIAFKCIHEDDLSRLGVSAAGLITISRLKERIGTIQHREACDKAMKEMLTVFIRVVRLNFIGLPRSGKTSLLLRLMEVIENIQAEKERLVSKNLQSDRAGKIPKEQPSTGLAESCQVFIKKCVSHTIGTISSSRKWSVMKDLIKEKNLLIQLIYNSLITSKPSDQPKLSESTSIASNTSVDEASFEEQKSEDVNQSELKASEGISQSELKASEGISQSEDDQDDVSSEDILSLISDAVSHDDTDLQKLLDDMILLINTDTGGQAEFLDLHSSLVDGPSLNLLFHRLQDDLRSVFETYYTYDDGSSTEPVESTLTVEEVLFQALSSIACFSGCFLKDGKPQEKDSIQSQVNKSKSKVMFVGTYRDVVPDNASFIKKDDALKMKVEDTKFFDKDIIKYADNKGQLMFSVNNKTGDKKEICQIRKRLEEVIEKNFEKIAIPVAWLVLSLYIRSQKWRTLSYGKCERIAGCLNIKSEDLQHVLWFFHHCIGVHLYYPDILGDTLICDVQVVFDSASNLIKHIYKLDNQPIQKQFREKAQFSLEDMENATVKYTDDLIPLQKLVKLLEHLGMLTIIPSEADEEQKYFMPCVLKSATGQELEIPTLSDSDPAPLILRFFSGYVPMGLFPAMITKLVSPQTKGWELVRDKKQGLWKNKVQFRITFGMQRYIVFLLSSPYYIKIAICHKSSVTSPLCAHVRSVIESVMKEIIKHQCLNDLCEYGFEKECPQGLEEADHLCIFVKKPEILDMVCFRTECQEEVQLEKKHKIWFPPPIPQNETLSDYEGLPPRKRARIEEGQSSDYYYQTDVDTDGFISSHSQNTVPGDPEPWSKEGKRKGRKLRSKESNLEKARPGPIQHPVLNEEITQSKLNLIQWKKNGEEKEVRLKEEMSVKWKEMGQNVDISDAVLKGYRGNNIECMDEVITKWKNKTHDKYPATWAGLIKLLKSVELNNLVAVIEEAADDGESTLYSNNY